MIHASRMATLVGLACLSCVANTVLVTFAPPTANGAGDDWISKLENAEPGAQELLRIGMGAADVHFAAIQKLSLRFEYEAQSVAPNIANVRLSPEMEELVKQGKGMLVWNPDLKSGGPMKQSYEGVLYKDGVRLRYDYRRLDLEDTEAATLFGTPGWQSVLRTGELLAFTTWNPRVGPYLDIRHAPPIEDWESKHTAQINFVDPSIHFVPWIKEQLRDAVPKTLAGMTRSREGDYDVLQLKMLFPNSQTRLVEIHFDRVRDFLPITMLSYSISGATRQLNKERKYEWSQHGGAWYPTRVVEESVIDPAKDTRLPLHTLKIMDVRINEQANLPANAFAVLDVRLSDPAIGIDRRQTPPQRLVKMNGELRPYNPGEKIELPQDVRDRLQAARAFVESELHRNQRRPFPAWAVWLSITSGLAFCGLGAWLISRRRRLA